MHRWLRTCSFLAAASQAADDEASVAASKPSYAGKLVTGPPGPNCTLEVCLNAENLCGEVDRQCHVLRRMSTGEELWRKVSFAFQEGGDVANPATGPFQRKESGYFSQGECGRDEPWMEFIYEGTWDHIGPSSLHNGSSLGSVTVTSVVLRLLKDKVCRNSIYDDSLQCLDTLQAMKSLCPCNGWDWSASMEDGARERDVVKYCQPASQCPIFNDQYVEKVQYFAYNASAEELCMTEASLDKAVAHRQDSPGFCVVKKEPYNCYRGVLAGARSTSIASLLFLLVIFTTTSL